MKTPEKIFLGIAAIAGLYLLIGWGMNSAGRTLAQSTTQQPQPPAAVQPGQTGGHYMPNGEWMEGTMENGGCTMGKDGGGCGGCGMNKGGGGCGCGGM